MFSFHKPKIYRSIAGCCICRAKSSSSRFTDSRRYEDDFEECFQISELRRGEICNACVLLVKRWKKLAPGTDRNWRHVVDARAGPGTKSITKIKNRAKQEWKEENKLKKYKHRYQPRSKKGASSSKSSASCSSSSSANHRPFSPSLSDDICNLSDLSIQSDASDEEDSSMRFCTRRRPRKKVMKVKKGPKRLHKNRRVLSEPVKKRAASCLMIDPEHWRRQKVCCGIVYIGRGECDDILVDPRFFSPCQSCRAKSQMRTAGKRLNSESSTESTESGVVCEEQGFPTPPITQPSSPAASDLIQAAKFNPNDLVLDLTTGQTVMVNREEMMYEEQADSGAGFIA